MGIILFMEAIGKIYEPFIDNLRNDTRTDSGLIERLLLREGFKNWISTRFPGRTFFSYGTNEILDILDTERFVEGYGQFQEEIGIKTCRYRVYATGRNLMNLMDKLDINDL